MEEIWLGDNREEMIGKPCKRDGWDATDDIWFGSNGAWMAMGGNGGKMGWRQWRKYSRETMEERW
jgi:hypothetical protein